MATWAMRQRYAYIAERLARGETINRADIVERFVVTKQTASATLQQFLGLNPGVMRYDGNRKAYASATSPTEARTKAEWRARALAAEAATLKWRPIAEAEHLKDGTRIIGHRVGRYRDEFFIDVIWWQPEFDAWIAGARQMVMAPGYLIDGQTSKLHSPEIRKPEFWVPYTPPVAATPSTQPQA